MKKFIFFVVVVLCAAINARAGGNDVTYTSWGNGLELVTGEDKGCPVYGLRKNGVEIVPARCKLIVSEELNVAVFYRTDACGIFSLYGWLYLDVYDLSTGHRIAGDKVRLNKGDAKLTWGPRYMDKFVAVMIQPCKIDGKLVYAVKLIDKTGINNYANDYPKERDLIILGLQNGKLCKYVSCLKPVVI